MPKRRLSGSGRLHTGRQRGLVAAWPRLRLPRDVPVPPTRPRRQSPVSQRAAAHCLPCHWPGTDACYIHPALIVFFLTVFLLPKDEIGDIPVWNIFPQSISDHLRVPNRQKVLGDGAGEQNGLGRCGIFLLLVGD